MKNLLLLMLFLTGTATQAQEKTDQNPFIESEAASTIDQSGMAPAGENPGNPTGDGDPEPVPIDDYIPVLVIVAAGIIMYTTYHRKSLS